MFKNNFFEEIDILNSHNFTGKNKNYWAIQIYLKYFLNIVVWWWKLQLFSIFFSIFLCVGAFSCLVCGTYTGKTERSGIHIIFSYYLFHTFSPFHRFSKQRKSNRLNIYQKHKKYCKNKAILFGGGGDIFWRKFDIAHYNRSRWAVNGMRDRVRKAF